MSFLGGTRRGILVELGLGVWCVRYSRSRKPGGQIMGIGTTRQDSRSHGALGYFVGIVLVGAAFASSTVNADSILLTVQRGPASGQITLSWTGGTAPFDVYRSTSPAGVVAPPHLLGSSAGSPWIDSPPVAPILYYVVTAAASPVCGNSVREGAEQCDDGNLVKLDGCDHLCRFEQVQRAIWFKMQFATDAVCTRNQLGSAFIGGLARTGLQNVLDTAISDGSISIILASPGISDLSGTNEAPFQLGFLSGDPETRGGTLPYNGSNDLDWWYLLDPATLTPARDPLHSLPASITSHALSAGPGVVALPLFPGGPLMRVVSTQYTITTGASSTPLVSSAGDPPGHLASEHLDPALTSYGTCGTPTVAGAGRLCGDAVALSLSQTPIDPTFVSSCTNGYTLANSMLDLLVTGCNTIIGLQVRSTQPDRSDPDAPPAGAGAPYTLVANAQRVVTSCRDRLNATVDLNTCLNAAAYSTFVKIATDRVIPR